jgi:hypothetical protein
MLRHRRRIYCMWNPWEWLKFFYEAAGHKHPLLSACGIVVLFASAGLFIWWRLDAQYNEDHPVPQSQKSHLQGVAPGRADSTPSPLGDLERHQEPVMIEKSNKPPIHIEQTSPVNSPNVIGDNNQVSINARPPQRILTPEQKNVLFDRLSRFPKPMVSIITVNSNSEVETFADSFEDLLKRMEWPLKSRSVSLLPSRGTGLGVYVRSQSEHPQAADALIMVLRSMDILVEASLANDLQPNEIRLFISSQ